MSVEFWKSWLDIGRAAQQLAAATQTALLIVGGGADTNVTAVEFEAWQEALAGTDHQLVHLDCITHALNCMDGTEIGANVAPEVIETIVGFMTERRRPDSSTG